MVWEERLDSVMSGNTKMLAYMEYIVLEYDVIPTETKRDYM